MTIAWSNGGGWQSVAMGVLIHEGKLPKPDLSAIVDTGRERQATWDYFHAHLAPYMREVGVEIEVVPHTLAPCDLYSKNGDMVMPAYTEEGRLGAFCSGMWKRDTFERWLRQKGVKTATFWLGFSLDEMSRATGKAHRPWLQPAYPLIDLRITRGGCREIIERSGLPMPQKSRCWCCPHQNEEEWAEVKANPVEWQKAVDLDEAIRDVDEQHAFYLHSSRVPLALADLTVDESFPLFRHCQDAGCWT